MKQSKCAAPRGRPREFDADEALQRALLLFWRKGYEGTSLSDLTEAMGINRPSLYAAYGNKEAIFRKAVERYCNDTACYFQEAMGEATARAAIERLLHDSVEALSNPDTPPGCLLVQGALTCGEDADCVRLELISKRLAGEATLRCRLERAVLEGELPAETNVADLARYFITVLHGLAVQGASGVGRDELGRVARLALRSWPGPLEVGVEAQ